MLHLLLLLWLLKLLHCWLLMSRRWLLLQLWLLLDCCRPHLHSLWALINQHRLLKGHRWQLLLLLCQLRTLWTLLLLLSHRHITTVLCLLGLVLFLLGFLGMWNWLPLLQLLLLELLLELLLLLELELLLLELGLLELLMLRLWVEVRHLLVHYL